VGVHEGRNASQAERDRLARAKVTMPTGAELMTLLDGSKAQLEHLRGLRDRARAAGVSTRSFRYERLDDDHRRVDEARDWLLGDLAADARCAPIHDNVPLKVHSGPVAQHVSNWKKVVETLRGTRYERYLED
jgi:hypothetical protein